MQYTRARNTVKSYEHCWRSFTRWCTDAGCTPLPATPATVLDFVTSRIELGRYRLSTIRIEIAGIQYRHMIEAFATPVDQPIKTLLRVAARKLQEGPRGKRALTAQHLRTICSALENDSSPMAKREARATLLRLRLRARHSSKRDQWHHHQPPAQDFTRRRRRESGGVRRPQLARWHDHFVG